MKKTGKWIFLSAFFIFTGTASLNAEIVDRVVASAGNEIVTLLDVEREGEELFAQIRASSSAGELEGRLYEARKNVVEKLLEKVLLLREGKRLGLEVGEGEVDRVIDNIKKDNKIDQKTLVAALKQEGMSYEAYREEVKEQALRARVIDRRVKGGIRVGDEDVEIYYQRNSADFKVDEEIKARHILFLVPEAADRAKVEEIKKRAGDVLEKAKNGEDFEKLARTYSEGPTASSGGDLGFFKRETMVKEFADAAFALDTGDVSGLVRSPFGYHIIKLEERRGGNPMPLEEAKNRIRNILYQQELEAGIRNLIRELKEEPDVEVRL